MVHAHVSEFTAAADDQLTLRTLPIFFEVLRVLLEAKVSVVAEAAFQDKRWRPGLEPLAERARLRVVQCHVDATVARARHRAAGDRRAHAPIALDDIDDWERAFASFDRLSISAPSIDVDTTDGYAPELPEIVDFVNRG
jgi:hypothetical protein